ncbi:MAG: ABC transporter ATP-binding protein/permease [Synechococcus sp.]
MNASAPDEQRKFRFDRQLWDRFIRIAQPYFFPLGKGNTVKFLGLIVVMLVAVIAFTFLLTIGVTFLGKVIFPNSFFETVAADFAGQIDAFLEQRLHIGAAAVLAACLIIFGLHSQQLKGRWFQWGMLTFIVFLLFAVNGLNVCLSFIFRFLDTTLTLFTGDPELRNAEAAVAEQIQAVHQEQFWNFLWFYGVILVVAVPILVTYSFVRRQLNLRWRKWLTQHFLVRYFDGRAYYELDSNSSNTEIDNPDQRISEDIRYFSSETLSVTLDVLDSVLTLLSFTAILYRISSQLSYALGGYAIVGTVIITVISARLIKINFMQLRLEGDFRYGLVHVRDNAEAIAFYQGEAPEYNQVSTRLNALIKNANLLIIWESLIAAINRSYNLFARLIPYAFVAPMFFAGDVDFGTIGQSNFAFFQVFGALSLIANRIEFLARFAASIGRLGEFYEAFDDPAHCADKTETHQIKAQDSASLKVTNLTLRTPNSEQVLTDGLNVSLDPGDCLLVVGASGCGKSSLMRAIAGLWNNGTGTIKRPPREDTVFLPQKPYMLLGSLREQLTYPSPPSSYSDDDLRGALAEVNLEELPERFEGFDAIEDWTDVLSLGEQQRLAFARILLSRPKYAILDESTSALDVANERMLYELLMRKGITYISVGHRPSLLEFHPKVLQMEKQDRGHMYSAGEYREILVSEMNI